jgi:hypothetical protein
MKINKKITLQIAYGRNPGKVDAEVPANYTDLHKNKIDYHIDPSKNTTNGRCIHILITIEPKDKETGFIQYIASYEYRVIEISKEEIENANTVLNWTLSQVWDDIRFDYITSMRSLNMPISGFPITPLVPNEEESEKEKKDDDKPSK